MARRVIRRTTDLDNRVGPNQWTMDRCRWREVPAYRIEWPDGEPTGTGLFASQLAAQRYASGRGWLAGIESDDEEECA
jgi:hypothetical protein